ncbi:hypothetical protein LIER_05706 [Lithospermum erythrorhizon]|uniref:Uncharacterized protein n=1 Tax=Lithospermum erythrorhizon TaxID=34254 RepID=A0AAV3P2F2_LITER
MNAILVVDKCVNSDRSQDWNKLLPLAEYSYNSNYHSSSKMTPFDTLYGHNPPLLSSTSCLKDVNIKERHLIQQWKQITEWSRQNLHQAQNKMKKSTDSRRNDKSIPRGRSSLLKIVTLETS